MDVMTQILNLSADLTAAGTILPAILLFMPKMWSDSVKKLVTFLVCVVFTTFMAAQRGDLNFDHHNINLLGLHFFVILGAAHLAYDKVFSPVTQQLAKKTPLKFLNRSNRLTRG